MTAKDANTENPVVNKNMAEGNKERDVPVQNPQCCTLAIKPSNAGTTKSCQLEARDPIIQLITNIMGSVPLGDSVTQYFFIQIFGFCKEGHDRLFPNIHGTFSNILPEFSDFKSAERFVHNSIMFEKASYSLIPNAILRMWGRLRAAWEGAFFEQLSYKEYLPLVYSILIKGSIMTKNLAGLEAVKKDFRIRGDLIEPGHDGFFRSAIWFSTAMETEYLEGIEIVCNSWERMRGEESFLSALFLKKCVHLLAWKNQPSNGFLKRLYKNDVCEKRLMELYCYFSLIPEQFNVAYDLLVSSSHSESLFEVLHNSLRNRVENELNYLLKVIKAEHQHNYDVFNTILICITSLLEFIKRVDNFRNEAMKNLRERGGFDYGFARSFDGIYERVLKIRELSERIINRLERKKTEPLQISDVIGR